MKKETVGITGMSCAACAMRIEKGMLNPVIAGAAMAMSSVSVVSNSLGLKRFRPDYRT